jgi:hypothetical protein
MVALILATVAETCRRGCRRRDVAVNAFFEQQAVAMAVAGGVAGGLGALAPVLLVELAVEADAGGGAFVESGEVAPEHEKVGAERERDCHVGVVQDAAVGADRNVLAGFLGVGVACAGDVEQGGGLAASDAFLVAGDAPLL